MITDNAERDRIEGGNFQNKTLQFERIIVSTCTEYDVHRVEHVTEPKSK